MSNRHCHECGNEYADVIDPTFPVATANPHMHLPDTADTVTLPPCPEDWERTAWTARKVQCDYESTQAGIGNGPMVTVPGHDRDKALEALEQKLLRSLADVRQLRRDLENDGE